MKKFTTIATVAATAAAIVFPAAAAQAVCANQAIYTFDGETGEVKTWNTDGDLISTLDTTIDSPDLAISSDLQQFLAFDNNDGELKSYNASTGALIDSNAITGTSAYGGSGAGAGVIAGGDILVDSGSVVVSIDLSTFVGTDFADLSDTDQSVDVALQGDTWQVAGDLLQLPDNDILAVAQNETVYADGVILVRIDPAATATPTAVGVIASDVDIWGAARAGDDIYLATADGALLKVASIPTSASLDPVSTTEIVSGGGSFWGAAGSNDSTEGNATCELAETGVDAASLGLVAAALVAAGGIAVVIRRRRA